MSNEELKVTYESAVEAREAKPERWTCGKYSMARQSDGRFLSFGPGEGTIPEHGLRCHLAILTAILDSRSDEATPPAHAPVVDEAVRARESYNWLNPGDKICLANDGTKGAYVAGWLARAKAGSK